MNNGICLLFAIIAFGCQEEPIVLKNPDPDPICNYADVRVHHPGEMIYGRVTGLKNCSPFVASAEAYIQSGEFPFVGIVINTYEDWGNFLADKEHISLIAQPSGNNPIGTWPLIKNMPPMYYQIYTINQDHDVFEDNYSIDEGYEFNEIQVSQIDSMPNTIYGSFEARFLLSSSRPSGRNPDTILFSNCVFEAWHH